MAILEALLLSLRRIKDREASAESPVAPRKCSTPSAAGDFPGYGVSWSALAGGWSGTGRQPACPWRGCPTPVRPPPRRAGCLCFSALGSPQPPRPPRLRGSWEPGGAAGWPSASPASPRLQPPERSPGSRARPRQAPAELQGGLGLPGRSPPPRFHEEPHLRPKNPFRTRILFRIKTFIYFFVLFLRV